MSGPGQTTGGSAPLQNAVLIAGPTASGKSALALDIAARTGGVIVNADSMQVYSVLRVLTARPGDDDLARHPHLLYGHVHPSVAYSTGAWLREVAGLIQSGALEGQRPIFVGGTGLYFRALLGGLSDMPEIPPHIRDRWRYKLMEEGPHRLHRLLLREDPEVGLRLKPSDGQRIVRALEVLETSGKSIAAWQAETGTPLVDVASARRYVLEPERAVLHSRIEARFDGMMAAGAGHEVARIVALGLDPALPAMKAIGVPDLSDALAGRLSVAEAITRAKAATRQYAKRQSTWFRNQFADEWRRITSAEQLFGQDR